MKKIVFLSVLCVTLWLQVFNTAVSATYKHRSNNTSTPTSTSTCKPGWSLNKIKYGKWDCDHPTSTPTATVSATPTTTPTATTTPMPSPTPSATPAVCVGKPVTLAPIYSEANMKRTAPGTVEFSWKPTDEHTSKFRVYYGMDPKSLNWNTTGERDITNISANMVPPGTVWAKVCSVGACGDEICGPVVDP